jgi:hypothetical protein
VSFVDVFKLAKAAEGVDEQGRSGRPGARDTNKARERDDTVSPRRTSDKRVRIGHDRNRCQRHSGDVHLDYVGAEV